MENVNILSSGSLPKKVMVIGVSSSVATSCTSTTGASLTGVIVNTKPSDEVREPSVASTVIVDSPK